MKSGIAVAFGMLAVVACSAAPMQLVKDGRSAAQIVVPELADAAETFAAQEIQKWVGEMTGAFLPVEKPSAVERQGKTWRLDLEGGIEAELSKGVFKGGVDAGYSYERDYGVDAKSFAPVARIARSARDAAALAAMMRPGPDGGVATAIPRLDEAADFQTAYDAAIVEATEAARRSERHFASIDKVGFANAANKIRTILLALELAAREGRITREAADRMIARFSNPPAPIPRFS